MRKDYLTQLWETSITLKQKVNKDNVRKKNRRSISLIITDTKFLNKAFTDQTIYFFLKRWEYSKPATQG